MQDLCRERKNGRGKKNVIQPGKHTFLRQLILTTVQFFKFFKFTAELGINPNNLVGDLKRLNDSLDNSDLEKLKRQFV